MDFALLHGQCVALGCLAASYLSASRGYISMDEVNEAVDMMTQFGLPTTIEGLPLQMEEIISATKNDKKMDSGVIKFILLRQIGAAYVDRTVTEAEMTECLNWLSGGTHEK